MNQTAPRLNPPGRKRATVLLMVVSMLALLVVIVIGFISLARSERGTLEQLRRGGTADEIVQNANELLQSRAASQLRSAARTVTPTDTINYDIATYAGGTLAGGDPSSYSAEDISGYGFSNYIRSFEPVWQMLGTLYNRAQYPANQNWEVVDQLFWPALTALEPAKGARPDPLTPSLSGVVPAGVRPTHRWLDTMPENDLDNDNLAEPRFDYIDIKNFAQQPRFDSDADGIPDADLLLNAVLTDAANAAAGVPVTLRGSGLRISAIPDANTTLPEELRLRSLFQSFNEQANYEVSTSVIAHGGMLSLYAPTLRSSGGVLSEPFNRDFALSFFDAFKNSADAQTFAGLTKADRDFIMDELAAYAADVDANLRRRGGLLASAPVLDVGETLLDADLDRRVPPILAVLQGESGVFGNMFRHTFIPYFPKSGVVPGVSATGSVRVTDAATGLPNSWSPINLGETRVLGDGQNERFAGARALALRAQDANATVDATRAREALAQRRYLTTVSNSDELARKQAAGEPVVSPSANPVNAYLGMPVSLTQSESTLIATPPASKLPAPPGATYQGELKFWLGECAKAYEPVVNGGSTYHYNPIRGQIVIERMARLFYDMLDSTDPASWSATVLSDPTPASTNVKEIVSRRQQALMLAVNTLGFMAPRDSSGTTVGWIDPPYYRAFENDDAGVRTGIEYVGYTPQPFFSEVVAFAHIDAGPVNTSPPSAFEIAVELFNPHDPRWVDASATPLDDYFALPLDQYAIGVDGANPNLAPLGTGLGPNVQRIDALVKTPLEPRINGRSFRLVMLRENDTNAFSSAIDLSTVVLTGFDLPDETSEMVKLTLWKAKRTVLVGGVQQPERWFPIDQIELKNPLKDANDNQSDTDSDGNYETSDQWHSAYRDSSPTRYFGADLDLNGTISASGQAFVDRYARWNGVSVSKSVDGARSTPDVVSLTAATAQRWLDASGAAVDPDIPGSVREFAPTSPLITMNAGPQPGRSLLPFADRMNSLPMFGNGYDLRPRSFPTVGFMMYVPRYSHAWALQFSVSDPALLMTDQNAVEQTLFPAGPGTQSARKPMSATLAKEAIDRYDADTDDLQAGDYPLDFGHMPLFDNRQLARGEATPNDASDDGYMTTVGKLPWGQLVFDYFTTLNPNGAGIDPLRVPGRINVNSASWLMLSYLPLMGPVNNGGEWQMMLRAYASPGSPPVVTRFPVISAVDPSPSFWDERVGMVSGIGVDPLDPSAPPRAVQRQIAADRGSDGAAPLPPAPFALDGGLDYYGVGGAALGRRMPWGNPYEVLASATGRYRLGPWLAQAAAGYRDGVTYVETSPFNTLNGAQNYQAYSNAHLRNWATPASGFTTAPFYGLLGNRRGVAGGFPQYLPYRDARPKTTTPLSDGLYGTMRGQLAAIDAGTGAWIPGMAAYQSDADPLNDDANESPTQYGFVSVGELLNVKGWDSSRHDSELGTLHASGRSANSVVAQGDFVKSVGLVALLDAQYLTTRSNTFTAYVSVTDRRDPQQSVRSQMTIDRSNLLPKLRYLAFDTLTGALFEPKDRPDLPLVPQALDTNPGAIGLETPVRSADGSRKPAIISQRRAGYFNSRFDE